VAKNTTSQVAKESTSAIDIYIVAVPL
jgi:hypothetical protein